MIKVLKFIGIWLLSIPMGIFYPIIMCFGYSMDLKFYKNNGGY